MALPTPLRSLDRDDLAFECSVLGGASLQTRARVPLQHRELAGEPTEVLSLLDTVPGADQFCETFANGRGYALFLPQTGGFAFGPEADAQAELGAIVVLPPELWSEHTSMLADWQYETPGLIVEQNVAVSDVCVFAQVNYSPDCWYVVLRGPQAGKIWWWEHDTADGLMQEPFARSLQGWAERLSEDPVPYLGGTIRYSPASSIDVVDGASQLYPEKLIRLRP